MHSSKYGFYNAGEFSLRRIPTWLAGDTYKQQVGEKGSMLKAIVFCEGKSRTGSKKM